MDESNHSKTQERDLQSEKNISNQPLDDYKSRFDMLVSHLEMIYLELEPDGRIRYVSPNCIEFYGYSSANLIGTQFSKFIPAQDFDQTIEDIKKDGYHQRIHEMIFSIKEKSGLITPARFQIIPIYDNNNDISTISLIKKASLDAENIENYEINQNPRYNELFNSAPIGIIGVRNGIIQFVNSKILELYGYKAAEELIGQTVDSIQAPEIRETQNERGRNREQGISEPEVYVSRGIKKNGESFPIRVSATKIDINNLPLIVAFIQDISEQVMNERLLQENEARYRSLVQDAPEAIFVYDQIEQQYIDANTLALELFKISPEKLTEISPSDLAAPIQPDGIQAEQHINSREIKEGDIAQFEWLAQDLEGRTFPAEIRIIRLPARENQLLRLSVVDISERKKVENSLRESEERFRLLFESSPLPIVLADLSGIKQKLDELGINSGEQFVHYCGAHPEFIENILEKIVAKLLNQPYLAAFGYETIKEANEGSFVSPISWDTQSSWILSISKWLDGQLFHSDQITLHNTDGSERFFSVFRRLIDGARDDWSSVIILLLDQTKQKRAEIALRESEINFRSIFELSFNPIIVTNPDNKLVRMNKAASELLGYSQEEIENHSLSIIYANPEDRGRLLEARMERGSLRNYPVKLQTKEGRIIDVVVNSSSRFDSDDQLIEYHNILQDMTEIRLAKRSLSDAQNMLKTIINNAPIVLWALDRSGMFITSMGKGLQRLGLKAQEVVGQTIFDVYGDYPQIIESNMAALHGETTEGVYQLANAHFEYFCRPQYNQSQQIIGMIGLAIDVTEIRQTEEELMRSREELMQSQKMEAIGRLAGGIAHDFNNMLTVILGYSELLETLLPETSREHYFVNLIRDAAESSASLVKQLLGFSRKQNMEPKIVNINAIIQDALKILQRVIGEDIQLHTRLDQNLFNIKADPTQINQILMNLLVNAREAMPQGGEIMISTKNIMMGSRIGQTGNLPMVELTISDTGKGMSEETIQHIFEPFYTTKEQGTGLGLATIYGIIQQHDGQINVDSKEGEGTTFKIYLPKNEETEEQKFTAHGPNDPNRGDGRILLVEDDESISEFASYVLKEAGYDITTTNYPKEALKLAANNDFDLIISDIIMPELNGFELINMLQEMNLVSKVLFITGYADQPIYENIRKTEYPILDKPFTPQLLLHKIGEILKGEND